MQGPSIVVGLDFGTTFSGVAWALEGSIGDIEVLSSWPGGGNKTSMKVPSVISYSGHSIQWGYQIGPLTEACRGIKLLFYEDQETNYIPSIASKSLLSRQGKDVVQVEEVIERRLGVAIKDSTLKFVLTVPAVWSDKAKDATLRAAIKAGIPTQSVSHVSEPEAAALYAMRAIQPNSTAKRDVFIVCDAGGGTVDLISYMIKNLEPLFLVEVTVGRVCGSMLLDQRFEELLREKIGFDNYRALSKKSKEAAVLYWQDRVKTNFAGKFDDDFVEVDYYIPVPGAKDDPKIPIEDGFVQLTSNDIEGIFDPIVQDTILLVGGFGASDYLFHRLQKANPSMIILQPPNGWSAVVSGAVNNGLEGNKVESRVARRNYGVDYRTTYDPNHHKEDMKNWDSLEEVYEVDNQMRWYIKKHSDISEHKPIRMDFYRNIKVTDIDKMIFHDTLLFCNDEDAPDIKNARIMKLCEQEANLSQIPKKLFKRKRNSKGTEYWQILYTLKMTPTSASLLFELEFNGVPYGSVTSRY
ncbi:hypothetical protein BDV12DRAFT_204359 [Aspergillus spectabilis]